MDPPPKCNLPCLLPIFNLDNIFKLVYTIGNSIIIIIGNEIVFRLWHYVSKRSRGKLGPADALWLLELRYGLIH